MHHEHRGLRKLDPFNISLGSIVIESPGFSACLGIVGCLVVSLTRIAVQTHVVIGQFRPHGLEIYSQARIVNVVPCRLVVSQHVIHIIIGHVEREVIRIGHRHA